MASLPHLTVNRAQADCLREWREGVALEACSTCLALFTPTALPIHQEGCREEHRRRSEEEERRAAEVPAPLQVSGLLFLC